MHDNKTHTFAFLVLAFNHQEYIVEHLESIKYLVQTYGATWDVDLIISDDASRDQTRSLVDRWLVVNATIFRNVKTIYNPKNLGTCACVNNMLEQMAAERCKLTAGDDVYSYENIFELAKCDRDTAIVSGYVLYLINNVLSKSNSSKLLAIATQIIYQKRQLSHRFKHLGFNNAPNIIYNKDFLINPRVRGYLGEFDVVEDWPLQVAIANEFSFKRMDLIDRVLVYYRRTSGSTYIVANRRFVNDKLKLFDDLIRHEGELIEKIRLVSRRYCFKSQNKIINKIFNLDVYFFVASFAFNFIHIVRRYFNMKIDTDLHGDHWRKIQSLANDFIVENKNAFQIEKDVDRFR